MSIIRYSEFAKADINKGALLGGNAEKVRDSQLVFIKVKLSKPIGKEGEKNKVKPLYRWEGAGQIKGVAGFTTSLMKEEAGNIYPQLSDIDSNLLEVCVTDVIFSNTEIGVTLVVG